MNAATQKGRILQYCAEHGSITVRDAVVNLYINSPRKCISELRKSGDYDVQTVQETIIHSDGTKAKFNRYFIKRIGGVPQ